MKNKNNFNSLFKEKPLIGVIHLPRLPSSYYKSEYDINEIIDKAVNESKLLEDYGFDGVIVENFGDKPYSKRVTDPLTISSMGVICREIVKSTSLVIGVNLLRNSGFEAYSIAVASGCRFIRINALSETIISDSGIIEPEAPKLKVLKINYPYIHIYADILVKHASSLSFNLLYNQAVNLYNNKSKTLETVLKTIITDSIERGGADAIILTGYRTGHSVDIELVKNIRSITSHPILIGSGVNPSNIGELAKYADGFIVGSFIRENGEAGKPLSKKRLEMLVKAFKKSRSQIEVQRM